jgi:ribosomal protein S18 acetylase RimI-like enzyme
LYLLAACSVQLVAVLLWALAFRLSAVFAFNFGLYFCLMHHSDPLSKLDAPAWNALTSAQQSFATGAGHVKRYRRGILPFAACEPGYENEPGSLSSLLEPEEIFYLIGDLPPLPGNFTVLKELPCAQMVLQNPVPAIENTATISRLTANDKEAMFNLINKVQPGYYEPDTYQLGNYVGIWQRNALVAIAGERMRLDGLTEISAICTDPDFTGRKYAQQLIAELCHYNLQQDITPFLHVLETNERAIRLYEYMGFATRRIISFWQMQKEK